MPPDDSAPEPEPLDPCPGEGDRLPPVRRSFPVPKRKEAAVEDAEEDKFAMPAWTMRAVLVAAVIVAGAAAWITFRPDGRREPTDLSTGRGTAPSEPRRAVSQDPAVEIYFTPSTPAPQEPREAATQVPPLPVAAAEVPPAKQPGAGNTTALIEGEGVFEMLNDPPAPAGREKIAVVETAPVPSPAPAPPPPPKVEAKPADPPGELELRYIAALDEAKRAATSDALDQFNAEIERVKKGEPIPPPRPGLHRELHRLQSIYRRERTKEPLPPPPSPEAREIEIYLMGGAPVTLLLNGGEVAMLRSKTHTSDGADYETQKAILTVQPGDVLGFHCREQTGQRYFGMAARAGRLKLFGSDKRWDATVKPDDAWWKGGGGATFKPKVQSNEIDYPAAAARGFQHHADTRFSSYDIIWAGTGAEAAFRYVVRAADLPGKTPER